MIAIHSLAPRLQSVDISGLIQLFPVLGWGGVALVAAGWAWSQAWPYLRDTHLPARNKAIQDQAQAMKDIAAVVTTIAYEVAETRRDVADKNLETRTAIGAIQADINLLRRDVAILMERRDNQERTRGAD